MKLVNGIAFPDADEFMVLEVRPDGTYQADHLTAALRHVTNFSCAVDGGAHVGLWTRILATRFQTVIAFEPSEDTCEALRWNISKAGLTNVEMYNAALGRSRGKTIMVLDQPNTLRGNTGARHVGTIGPLNVPVWTIDSRRLTTLGFLKLDVEGSELAALQGATDTLRRCKPVVLVENKGLGHRYFNEHKTAVRDFLLRQRFQLAEKAGCDEIWVPR